MVSKSYEATNQIYFKLVSNVDTKYGLYTFPSQKIQDYIDSLTSDEILSSVIAELKLSLTSSALKDSIRIQYDSGSDQKYISVTTTSQSYDEAKTINNSLIKTYLRTLKTEYKTNAIKHFITTLNNEVTLNTFKQSKLQSEIEQKQEVLNSIQTVYSLQKGIFTDPKVALIVANQLNQDLSKLSDAVIVEQYLNQNYFKAEAELIDSKNTFIETQNTLEYTKDLLVELKTMSQSPITLQENDSLNVLEGSIYLLQEDNPSVVTISRNTVQTTLISAVLTSMISIFLILFKNYWTQNP